MRKILLLICLLCSLGCMAQETEVSMDTIKISKLGLNGKIKSCKDMIYRAVNKNGKVVKGRMCSYETKFAYGEYGGPLHRNRTYIFDETGRQVKLIYNEPLFGIVSEIFEYRNDSMLFQTTVNCHYTDVGNKTAQRFYYYTAENKIANSTGTDIYGRYTGKQSCTYNNHGDIIKFVAEDKDGSIDRQKDFDYEYKNNKIVYKRVIEKNEGICTTIQTSTYDEKGRLLSSCYDYFDSDEYKHYINTEYNEYNINGKLTRVYNVNENSGITYDNRYTYDETGRLIKINDVTNPHVYTKIDPDNKVKVECYYETNSKLATKEYKDNAVVRFVQNGITYTYKYTYDNHGNWIKAIEYKNKVPNLIRERTIEYYE